MNIDASQVIERYKALLSEAQYRAVLLEVQVDSLQQQVAELSASAEDADNV